MVQPVVTDEDIHARLLKVRSKIKHIGTQRTLDDVLRSFPDSMRREIYDELAPSLKFKHEFKFTPEETHE